MFLAKSEILEDLGIWRKNDFGSIRFVLLSSFFGFEFPLSEICGEELTFAIAGNCKLGGKRIHGLGPNAVQANAELEYVIVVLGASIDARNAFNHLTERDTASEITYADAIALDRDINLPAVSHDELVHSIVDRLFEQNINAIIIVGTVAEPPDVHAGAHSNVLQRGEGFDLAFIVIMFSGWHR